MFTFFPVGRIPRTEIVGHEAELEYQKHDEQLGNDDEAYDTCPMGHFPDTVVIYKP